MGSTVPDIRYQKSREMAAELIEMLDTHSVWKGSPFYCCPDVDLLKATGERRPVMWRKLKQKGSTKYEDWWDVQRLGDFEVAERVMTTEAQRAKLREAREAWEEYDMRFDWLRGGEA